MNSIGFFSTSGALSMGAQQQSRDTHDFSGWRSMDSAPRDGTVIEIKNTYGVAPSYGIGRWSDGKRTATDREGKVYEFQDESGWVDAQDPCKSWFSEGHLHWRPYSGDVAAYVDPTGGMQNSMAYWRGAVARKYGLPLDHFEADAARNERKNAKAAKPKSWWRMLLGI